MQSTSPPHVPSKHALDLRARSVVAIRELVVPETAPPYDDEREGYPPGAGPDIGGNAGRSASAATSSLDAAVGQDQPSQNSTDRVRAPIQISGSPEPDGWPRQFAQVLAETLAGVRPARQLTPWTSEQARRQIRQLGPLLAGGQLPRLRRIMTSAPASHALELTAVVGFGERVRVLAVRLERDPASASRPGGGWYCTAVESA
jgi:Family of unknown function (DUF6459)